MTTVRIECPYDRHHKILPLKMPYHLHKCRKSHPQIEMAVCPYNAMHEVKAQELKYHMSHCPNRTLLERMDMPHDGLHNAMLGKEERSIKGNTDMPIPVRTPHTDPEQMENWDEDEESPIVLPTQDSGRSMRRNRTRRQVDSQLRRPQRQSIAASFTTSPVSYTDTTDRNNDTGGRDINSNVNYRSNNSNSNVNYNNSNSNVNNCSENNTSSSFSSSRNNISDDRLSNWNNLSSSSSTPLSDSRSRLLTSGEEGEDLQRAECSMRSNPSTTGTGSALWNSSLFKQRSSSSTSSSSSSSSSISPPRPPLHSMSHLFAMGRGRASPTFSASMTQSPPLTQKPGLSVPFNLRMGRGFIRPSFKS